MTVLLEDKPMRPSSRPDDHGGMPGHERHIVERLAKETDTPEQEARHTYERERDRLDKNARVKTYVSVIAARHARDTLRRKHG
jgi:hypothetical protein